MIDWKEGRPLRFAAKVFRHYQTLHGNKGIMGAEKAAANGELAEHMERMEREQYGLALLAEESSEVIQMVGKWLRFGPDHGSKDGLNARIKINREAGDQLAAIDWCIEAGVLDWEAVVEQRRKKFARLTDPLAKDDEGRPLAPALPAK